MTQPADLDAISIRPTLPRDRADILDFCARIWDGHDYIPLVFDEWMADPDGQLFTVELDGRAVGLGRLTWLSPGQWWLEGLRVDPHLHDRHVGALLHDFLNRHWDETGDGMLRLTTHQQRVKVQHMCERSGFERVGQQTVYGAPARSGAIDDFRLVAEADAGRAVAFALASPTRELGFGLNDFGWQYGLPNERLYHRALSAGRAWWWRGGRGLLVGWDDVDNWEGDETPQPALMVTGLACAPEDLPALLSDMTALAGSLNAARACWIADIQAESRFAAIGYRRIWDDSVYLYARGHPGNGK